MRKTPSSKWTGEREGVPTSELGITRDTGEEDVGLIWKDGEKHPRLLDTKPSLLPAICNEGNAS